MARSALVPGVASGVTGGHAAFVGELLRCTRSDALRLAAISALTTGAGVFVLAYRCDNAVLDDGPVPFAYVMIAGLLLLVAPFGLAVCVVVGRSPRWIMTPVGVLSSAVGVVTAALQPGNLIAIGFLIVLAPALVLLWSLPRVRRAETMR
jgi:hypothetical protein